MRPKEQTTDAGPTLQVRLGTAADMKKLFSWPNTSSPEPLLDTIQHWLWQTVERDGFADLGARLLVSGPDPDGSGDVTASFSGPEDVVEAMDGYRAVIPAFLTIGMAAYQVVKQLKGTPVWDPKKTGMWRFFLPLGLPMLSYSSPQFYHYPPLRLLQVEQDYLNDPVPIRYAELLEANQASDPAPLYERFIDATPIAAPDDQGNLLPITHFADYQKAMVSLFLKPWNATYTQPLLVYGAPARKQFAALYGLPELGIMEPVMVEIQPGLQTPVIGANHPYNFYWVSQHNDAGTGLGSGHLGPHCAEAVPLMQSDLAATRWQVQMAADPTQPADGVARMAESYWADPARTAQVCQFVQHQGSLLLSGPNKLQFSYTVHMEQAAAFCGAHENNPCAGL